MRTSDEKFRDDLEIGNMGEREMADFLKENNDYTIVNFGNTSDYDIKMKFKGREILIEVKTDRWEHYKNKITNNMFIEVSCDGKLSGIHSTKSHLFIYFFPDQETAYFIKSKDLRELIKTDGLSFQTARGSDGERVRGVLINKIRFENWVSKDSENNEPAFKIKKVKKSPIWD
jgi:hypothetical protein